MHPFTRSKRQRSCSRGPTRIVVAATPRHPSPTTLLQLVRGFRDRRQHEKMAMARPRRSLVRAWVARLPHVPGAQPALALDFRVEQTPTAGRYWSCGGGGGWFLIITTLSFNGPNFNFSSFLFTSFHFYISGKFHQHSSFYAIIHVCMLILCDVKTCPIFFKYLDGVFYTNIWLLRIKGHFVLHRYPSNFWMGSLVFWKYLSFFHKFWQVFTWGKALGWGHY